MQRIRHGCGTRVSPENDAAIPSKGLRGQFLVGSGIFDQPVDMNSGFMGECACADDRFPWRNGTTGGSSDQRGKTWQLCEVHIALALGEAIQACHDLFECGIPRSFPKTENAHAGMACAPANCSKGIRGGRAQIVVPVKLKFEGECSS